jgi:hypothetical protein
MESTPPSAAFSNIRKALGGGLGISFVATLTAAIKVRSIPIARDQYRRAHPFGSDRSNGQGWQFIGGLPATVSKINAHSHIESRSMPFANRFHLLHGYFRCVTFLRPTLETAGLHASGSEIK